jgi:Tat protein secretion system quality control protein TatD with DNase activity
VTARALAHVRGEDLEQLCRTVTSNAQDVFGTWEL